jgi:putative ATPase
MIITESIKPVEIRELVGQKHLTDQDSLLNILIEKKDFDSLCFYGPPGTGKTTLAKLISEKLHLRFYKFHAATTSISDIKKILNEPTIDRIAPLLVIDEVHQFNKNQQCFLLDFLDNEKGKIITTSTENPYYSLIPAFRSRSYLFEFVSLSESDLMELYLRARNFWLEKNRNIKEIVIEDRDIKNFINISNGDARKFLNIIEAAFLSGSLKGDVLFVKSEQIRKFVTTITYSEDEHYDLLSAMIKSIRGSDPDAALLWAFKLLKTGISPEVVLRRLLISASEDIGNAYPYALTFVSSAYKAFEKVGLPEGNIIISHIITFLASCPKSNRSYVALSNVKEYLEQNNPYPPENIRHAAKGYKYPFDYNGFVVQKYMEENKIFYRPSNNGFEVKIADRLKKLWDKIKIYE